MLHVGRASHELVVSSHHGEDLVCKSKRVPPQSWAHKPHHSGCTPVDEMEMEMMEMEVMEMGLFRKKIKNWQRQGNEWKPIVLPGVCNALDPPGALCQ